MTQRKTLTSTEIDLILSRAPQDACYHFDDYIIPNDILGISFFDYLYTALSRNNNTCRVIEFSNIKAANLRISSSYAVNTIIGGSEITELEIASRDSDFDLLFFGCFIESANFKDTNCDGMRLFKKCTIKGLRCRSTYNRPLSFDACKFGTIKREFEETDFSDSEFRAALDFSNCLFYSAPQFFGSKLHPNTNFSNATFFDVETEDAWRAYRTLKQVMIQHESEHEAALFHALELEARKNTVLPSLRRSFNHPDGLEKLASCLLKLTSNYGRDLRLPLLWLGITAFIFYKLYASYGGLECISNIQLTGWVKDACRGDLSILFSFRNLLGPFGLLLSNDAILPSTLSVKYLGLAHITISSCIWFIWLLQIRSRFKM